MATLFESFLEAGGKQITLVLGYYANEYLEALEILPSKYPITTQINPNPSNGQFSSLQVGLGKTPGPCYVLPVDCPPPPERLWFSLEKALVPPYQVSLPHYKSRGGHPLLLSEAFSKTLLSVAPTERLDHLIHALSKSEVCYVESEEPSITLNLNTKADFEEWTRRK